jgi:hypothetical protein
MRDAESPLAFAALETPIAEERSKDDLDLHRIRHDTPEDALWMLPHAMNVGTGLPPVLSSLPLEMLGRNLRAGAKRLGDQLRSASVHPPLDDQGTIDESSKSIRERATFE